MTRLRKWQPFCSTQTPLKVMGIYICFEWGNKILGDGRQDMEMTCKSGTHLSIKRLNSQVHVAEKNNYMLAYAMGEFGQEHLHIYLSISMMIKKSFFKILKSRFSRMSAQIVTTTTKPSVSFCSPGLLYNLHWGNILYNYYFVSTFAQKACWKSNFKDS